MFASGGATSVLISTLKEKAKTIKSGDKFDKMGQIIRFAQSRGFEPEMIHRYLPEVVKWVLFQILRIDKVNEVDYSIVFQLNKT